MSTEVLNLESKFYLEVQQSNNPIHSKNFEKTVKKKTLFDPNLEINPVIMDKPDFQNWE